MVPWDIDDLVFDETRFKGVARLFPLPDLILFPHVMQPLRIFEPRYRELLNDALDSDGLIAMCLPEQGMTSQKNGQPPLVPVACLGKIVTHQRTERGEYNVLLLGMRRIQITRELPMQRGYRLAEVSLLNDFYDSDLDARRAGLQQELTKGFQEYLPQGKSVDTGVLDVLSKEIPLSVLTDLVSFALPMEFKYKRELLGECDIDKRAAMLLEVIRSGQTEPSSPPRRRFTSSSSPFSLN